MGFISFAKEEFQVIKERDPAIKSPMEVLLYPTFRVMLSYRRAHRHYLKGHFFRARYISQRAARKTGIEIHRGQCDFISGGDFGGNRKRDGKAPSYFGG